MVKTSPTSGWGVWKEVGYQSSRRCTTRGDGSWSKRSFKRRPPGTALPVSGVAQAGKDVVLPEVREVLQNLFRRHARREV